MDPKFLRAFFLQDAEGFKHLRCGHSVFCISGIVHDAVSHLKHTARIIAAANAFRDSAQGLFQEINMCEIIQINGSSQFAGIHIILCRRVIGGEHNVIPCAAHGFGQHQLCVGGAVTAAAVFS